MKPCSMAHLGLRGRIKHPRPNPSRLPAPLAHGRCLDPPTFTRTSPLRQGVSEVWRRWQDALTDELRVRGRPLLNGSRKHSDLSLTWLPQNVTPASDMSQLSPAWQAPAEEHPSDRDPRGSGSLHVTGVPLIMENAFVYNLEVTSGPQTWISDWSIQMISLGISRQNPL